MAEIEHTEDTTAEDTLEDVLSVIGEIDVSFIEFRTITFVAEFNKISHYEPDVTLD